MAEKLGVGAGVHELKIGDSFFQSLSKTPSSSRNPKKHHGSTFHTIRYDFKPASSSTAEAGFLRVDGDDRGVTVDVPNNGGGQTKYSGHQNPSNQKECVLIIDRETGEITLERLSSQLLVKKTRPERQETPNLPAQKPTQPAPVQKPPAPPVPPPQASSKGPKKAKNTKPSAPGSMPSFGLEAESQRKDRPTKDATGTLSSDSSSESSSSGSDSDSNDESEDDESKKPTKRPPAEAGMPVVDSFSMPTFSQQPSAATSIPNDSDSFSSSDDDDMVTPSAKRNSQPKLTASVRAPAPSSSSSSMPSVSMPHLLGDGLALSESDSD